MGRTPDRFPGEREDEGILLEDAGTDPVVLGGIRRVGTDLKGRDGAGVFNLRGISEAQHEDLDTLVHDLAETSYAEVTRVTGQVSNVTTWTTSGKTTKIREVAVTRSAGQVATIVRKHYDASGTLIAGQTLTGTVTRLAGRVASIDWVQS